MAAEEARIDRAETIVGVVRRPHGVRGEVNVEIHTDEPERRFSPGCVLLAGAGGRELHVRASRRSEAGLLVSFAEITDRTAAEALHGCDLVALVDPREGPADPSEFYDRQLVGLRVIDAHGRDVGAVSEVVHLPAQDLLVVQTGHGERLVPFVTALVPQVDLAVGLVRLADVGGLIDDLPEEAGDAN